VEGVDLPLGPVVMPSLSSAGVGIEASGTGEAVAMAVEGGDMALVDVGVVGPIATLGVEDIAVAPESTVDPLAVESAAAVKDAAGEKGVADVEPSLVGGADINGSALLEMTQFGVFAGCRTNLPITPATCPEVGSEENEGPWNGVVAAASVVVADAEASEDVDPEQVGQATDFGLFELPPVS
ncbi:hypothetical protein ABZP36_035663, partial [Zizania latifolia]